jgi:hypothetical protein
LGFSPSKTGHPCPAPNDLSYNLAVHPKPVIPT